jgi:carboxyl-terminal processing protease
MRKALLILFLLSAWITPAFASPPSLKMEDIPRVMDRLFHFHIENKELSATLIRRSIKLYIEQFDPEKAYLLESEVIPFIQISESRAQEILEHVQDRDYRDFVALNRALEASILRAQRLRSLLGNELASGSASIKVSNASTPAHYASSEKDLIERQKNRMVRFYLFHEGRTKLDTQERRLRVFQLFERKVQRAESNYILVNNSQLSPERVQHLLSLRILKAFAKSLDTHTAFFSPEEAYEMRLSLEKQFEGVGVILSEGIDGVMIADLIEGSPAELSGRIRINDLLVEIDGQPIQQTAFEDVLDMLKKKDRSEIVLGFKRIEPGSKEESHYRVSLKKRPISMKEDRIKTSFERQDDGSIIGKIALYSFYEGGDGFSSEKDIKEAIRFFREQGELKGLVLDLRENSGGFLGQAVRVAGLFVSNGVIVISKYGKGDVHYLRNIVGKSFFSGPLVVLTSKMSASASEIVAQALQDYGVALIVGDERTFGKGSIQYQTITDVSADLFFKVTVGRYYTVSGRSTQIDGVKADIVVPTQYAPYNIGERYLEYPLPQDQIESAYVDPLTDLDEKARLLFQKRYTPYVQRVVSFWKKMLPTLRANSARRISNNPEFQAFLKKAERVRLRQSGSTVNSVDEPIQIGMDDVQMNEAVDVVKDMIQIDTEVRSDEAALFEPTGSE